MLVVEAPDHEEWHDVGGVGSDGKELEELTHTTYVFAGETCVFRKTLEEREAEHEQRRVEADGLTQCGVIACRAPSMQLDFTSIDA